MKVEPAGADLLRVARDTLLQDLLPRLPAESHYAARMAANAMAIAMREMEGRGADPHEEIARIASLLPEWKPRGDESARLGEGNALLAAAIRAGRFDEPDAQEALIDHLERSTAERLALSNPKAR
jgi:hypothetical protein